jgi:hypothetical protein
LQAAVTVVTVFILVVQPQERPVQVPAVLVQAAAVGPEAAEQDTALWVHQVETQLVGMADLFMETQTFPDLNQAPEAVAVRAVTAAEAVVVEPAAD